MTIGDEGLIGGIKSHFDPATRGLVAGCVDKERAVRTLCGEHAAGELQISLRPSEREAGRAFQSWGQVFELGTDESGGASRGQLVEVSKLLTCWGDGRLNARRASDGALLAIARLALNRDAARRLVAVRRQNPRWTLAQWLGALDIDRRVRQRLERLLAEESNCYSLEVTASSGARDWCETLLAEQDERQVKISRFVW